MTDLERCREHSTLIKDVMVKQACTAQALMDVKENHNELKDAFWKVEGNLRDEIKDTSNRTTKLQIRMGIVNTLIFVVFGIANATAIKMLINHLAKVTG